MQTFITSTATNHAFAITARDLDNKRLNKQALEAWQILMTNLKLDPEGNHREPRGWYNHPATKMWRGHEVVLTQYIEWMCEEWRRRGFRTTIDTKALETLRVATEQGLLVPGQYTVPWIEDQARFEAIASTHRTALLVKNYEWYHRFGWDEDPGHQPDGYEYIWGMENNNA